LYVSEEGPVIDAFRGLFETGYEQLIKAITYPADRAAEMAFTNKHMASVHGGFLWSHLLTVYEYMEPLDNAYQSEWRIVNPNPLYGHRQTTREIIQKVSPPRNWAKHVNVLKFPEDAIVGFVCPRGEEEVLKLIIALALESAGIENLGAVIEFGLAGIERTPSHPRRPGHPGSGACMQQIVQASA
jgi:hypothetical protein